MHFTIRGRGEYITIRSGKRDLSLKQLLDNADESSQIKVTSSNAYVVTCLQDGTMLGREPGKATVSVYDGRKRLRKIRVIVSPGAKNSNSLPVLVNAFNRIPKSSLPPKNLIKKEAGTYNWNTRKDIFACEETAKAYDAMSRAAASDNVFMQVSSGYRPYEGQDMMTPPQEHLSVAGL